MRAVLSAWTIAVLLAIANANNSCAAEEITGRVVAVHDGDTLTVLVGRKPVKVRLAEIDAPELGQPFGRASGDTLKALCAGQQVGVTPMSTDRYGRTIGRVTCRGTDASTHQVRNGMAWVFDRYAEPSSPLYASQAFAREAGRGLWAGRDPVPPWKLREARRQRSDLQ